MWDLEAKLYGKRVWELAKIPIVSKVETSSISLDSPGKTAARAKAILNQAVLKLKLGGDLEFARVRALREAAPAARLLIYANESRSSQHY